MTKPTRTTWITECADYIREKQARDNFNEGRELADGQAQNKREELKEKLETALKKADAAVDALAPLHKELQLGLVQFDGMATRIGDAWDSALTVQRECRLALTETLPTPRTRELDLHKRLYAWPLPMTPVLVRVQWRWILWQRLGLTNLDKPP